MNDLLLPPDIKGLKLKGVEIQKKRSRGGLIEDYSVYEDFRTDIGR